jgi:hypothetical protein
MFCATQNELFEGVGQSLCIDVHFGAAGSEKLGLPGCGIRTASDDDALSLEGPEDRKLGERRQAGRIVIPRRLQDIHR